MMRLGDREWSEVIVVVVWHDVRYNKGGDPKRSEGMRDGKQKLDKKMWFPAQEYDN